MASLSSPLGSVVHYHLHATLGSVAYYHCTATLGSVAYCHCTATLGSVAYYHCTATPGSVNLPCRAIGLAQTGTMLPKRFNIESYLLNNNKIAANLTASR